MKGRRKSLDTFDGQLLNFFDKINTTGDCWIWQAAINKGGYGTCRFFQKKWLAHRLSWYLFFGDFDKSLSVCYWCNNPSCVRPQHLYLGTQIDNMTYMKQCGRQPNNVGELNPNAKIDIRAVNEIRGLRNAYRQVISETVRRLGLCECHVQRIANEQFWVSPSEKLEGGTDKAVEEIKKRLSL